MAYMHAWLPYDGTYWDHAVLLDDICAFLTGSTSYSDMNLLKAGTGSFVSQGVNAGWTLEKRYSAPNRTSAIALTTLPTTDSTYGLEYAVLSPPAKNFPSYKKYIGITVRLNATDASATVIYLSVNYIDDWDGNMGLSDHPTRYGVPGSSFQFRRNVNLWFDMSADPYHILFSSGDKVNNSNNIKTILGFERTTIHTGDSIENGYTPWVWAIISGDGFDGTTTRPRMLNPVSDNGFGYGPYLHFGGLEVMNFSQLYGVTSTKNSTEYTLLWKPTVACRGINIGQMISDVPVWWVGDNAGLGALSQKGTMQEIIINGESYMVHGLYPSNSVLYPILVKVT